MVQKIWKSLSVFLLVILLVGCIEMSEEIWLNSDTSGRLKIDIGLSERIIGFAEAWKNINNDDSFSSEVPNLSRIEEELFPQSNLQHVVVQEYSDSGTRHFLIDLTAKDFHDLPELSENIWPNSSQRNTPQFLFSLKDMGQGVLLFQQNTGGKVQSGKAMGKALLNLVFEEDGISVVLHAPHINSSNGQVSDDRQVATWKIWLSDPNSWQKLEAELDNLTS